MILLRKEQINNNNSLLTILKMKNCNVKVPIYQLQSKYIKRDRNTTYLYSIA